MRAAHGDSDAAMRAAHGDSDAAMRTRRCGRRSYIRSLEALRPSAEAFRGDLLRYFIHGCIALGVFFTTILIHGCIH